MRLLLPLLFAVIWAQPAYARPVSYPGGWTVMQMNDVQSHSLHVHYSPTARDSIGYKGEYFRRKDWQFHGVQYNRLLNRWNGKGSQANLYFKTGAGAGYSDYEAFDGKTEAAAFAGLAADWETRRYFTSYETRGVYAGDIDRFFAQSGRVGIAPYIGDYGDLHTWLMLQVDHRPGTENSLSTMPLVRLFKGETMVEAGMSFDGDVLFNFVQRF